MWRTLAVAFSIITHLDAGQAISLHKRDADAAPAVLLDISRKHVADPVARDLRRRSSTLLESLDNEDTLYLANITLGTPGQRLRVTLDTGSSDLWVNTPSSALCSKQRNTCAITGTYDANSSSTYKYLSSDFNIKYLDGSGARGDYVTDTLSIGEATLDAFQFGIGYASSSTEGVLGVGYPTNEAQASGDERLTYANLPQALVDAGLIKSSAYSLWLNDLDANTGSILFGGVDTEKFVGDLETLPIETVNGVFAEFLITLTGVSFNNGSTDTNFTSSELPTVVILDSGSSLTYLPDPIVEDIYSAAYVFYDSATQMGLIPCSNISSNAHFNFTFSGASITVDISELLIEMQTQSRTRDGDRMCVFGISKAGNGSAILGDTFLRSAYVVYDLDNDEISLAQTRFNSSSQNIMEIGTGSSSVPGATAVSDPVTSATGTISGDAASPSGTSGAVSIRSTLGYVPLGVTLISVVLAFGL